MTAFTRSDYQAHLRTLGVDNTLLVTDATGVIGAARGTASVSVTLLPPLRLEGVTAELGTIADLRLGEMLGQGGMGIVLNAQQLPLRRQVAVKRLHTLDAAPSEQAQLLQEALVLGALEHPNVVPVYVLGRGPDGRALLVMKRIDGHPWSADIAALYPSSVSLGGDPVDTQLRILLQICNAVHFAHGKGVVHRDLKPDNVMIGAFGEVYVVDWGIAVAIRADAPGELEPASSVQSIVGTPAYMAPEMAAGMGERIDARTDVYLLGAILHELITGHAPHEADTVLESLEHAFVAEPFEYDRSVPRELALIARRAMNHDSDERFASAAALHCALLEFLAHRASAQVCDEALVCLHEVSELVAHRGDPTAFHERASAARFGFQQALRSWPDNAPARDGLQHLLEVMIARALDREDAEAAGLLIGELPEPRAALEAAHDELRRTLTQRQDRIMVLEHHRYETDPTVAANYIRGTLITSAAILIPILTLGILRALGLHRAGYPDAIGVLLLVTVAAVWQARQSRLQGAPRLIQQLLEFIVAMALLSAFALAVCAMFGLDLSVGLAVILILFANLGFAAGAYVDRRFYLGGIPLCLAAMAIALWPAWRGLHAALGLFIDLLLVRALWSRLGADLTSRADPPRS